MKIITLLYPVLIQSFVLWIFDAFFWTIGPLINTKVTQFTFINSLFLTAYTVPAIFSGLFVGKLTKKFGKKRTSFVSFLGACVLLTLFFLTSEPALIIVIVFFSATLFSFATPSINGAYADYISENPQYEKEISAMEDFSANIGYILGPMLAGLLAEKAGNLTAFPLLGVEGSVIVIILLIITPKHIRLRIEND
jgi:MFS family permease